MQSCVYWFIFFLLWNCNKALDKIKIGGIFDNSSIHALTAFRHEVHIFNRELPYGSHGYRYQLHDNNSVVEITDSFSVMNALCLHLSRGDLAIFGVSNASSLPVIQSYSDAFRVPYVSISTAPNRRQNDTFQIYMRPIYTDALVNVMIFYKWEKVTFFYDSDEGLVRLQQLFQAINQYVHLIITIDTRRIATSHDGYTMLRELHIHDPEAQHTILLDFHTSKAEQIILKVYNDTSINNARFHFLLGDLGILEMDLTAFVNGGLNITGFQLVDPYNRTSEIFMSQWKNLDRKLWPGAGTYHVNYEAALAADAVRLFNRAFGSILKDEPHFMTSLRRNRYSNINTPMKCTDDTDVTTRHGKKILNKLKKVNFQGITGHVAFDETGHRKDFTLDLYTVEMFRGTAKVGYWSQKEKRIHIQKAKLFRHQDNSSENRTMIITTIVKEPYVMLKTSPKDGRPFVGIENLEGFCIDLIKLVNEKVDFDFKIKFVDDDSYGELLPNGTWDGMVGELIRGEADMAIAAFTITADRSRVIDFTKPFMSLGISIMIQRPTPAGKGFFSFMDPLSYEIWMCIVFAYIGVSVVLFLVSRFSPKEWHVTETEQDIENDFSISNSLWFSLGALMQQGCDISPRSVSGRIVGSVWWFFTLIIISSYTANLAAFLTVERMLTPINSAEDLAKQTEIQYGTIMSGATKAFFKNSQYQTYKRMWAFMSSAQPSVFVQKHEEGIEMVRNSSGKYAYITESTTIEYVSNRLPCDTLKVGNNLNSNGFGIATPLGFSLKNKLNFAVLKLRENGVLATLEKKWFVGEEDDCKEFQTGNDVGQSALSLKHVAGIFYLLIGGLVIAVCSAGIELMYKSREESSHSKISFGCALRSKARLSFKRRVDKDSDSHSHNHRRPHHSVTYTYTRPTNVCGVKHDFETPDNHTEV